VTAQLTDQKVEAFWVEDDPPIFCLRSWDRRDRMTERHYRVCPLLDPKTFAVTGWELKERPKQNPEPPDRFGADGKTPVIHHVELTRFGPECQCGAGVYLTHRLNRPCKHLCALHALGVLTLPPRRDATAAASRSRQGDEVPANPDGAPC
jgi:hypothetical protein